MINYILALMILISCGYAFMHGGASEVSNAIITSGGTAVSLFITIVGSMATWGGIMKVAQASGLTDLITRIISPLLSKIFKGIDKTGHAFKAIAMNIAANLFGLGNAATPLGIEAMKALESEEGCGGTASRNMIILTVFNTSSVEIIPTTVATLRLAHGSSSPLDILPCVLLVSVISLSVSILFVYLFDGVGAKPTRKEKK